MASTIELQDGCKRRACEVSAISYHHYGHTAYHRSDKLMGIEFVSINARGYTLAHGVLRLSVHDAELLKAELEIALAKFGTKHGNTF